MIDLIKRWAQVVEQGYQQPLQEALEDIVDALYPYHLEKNIFVSFSDIPKLGINPQTDYNTPAGIYSYPVNQMWPSIKANTIPYAGERQYALVLKPRTLDGVVFVSTYSSAEFSQHMRILEEKVVPRIVGSTVVDPGFFVDFFDEARRESILQTPAGWLWNTTRLLATMWARDFNGPKPTVGWNAIMRALGIKGVADTTGAGLIHPNEPVQAVWFSANSVELLSIARNIRKTSVNKMAQLALIRKNPDNIWRFHHPDRSMWDIALQQDALALIGRAVREGRRIPFGALLQASKRDSHVVANLLHYGYKLNDQQKIALIKSNPEAPRYFRGRQIWNDQLARAAVAAHPGMLQQLELSPSLTRELIELATQLHQEDAVWAAKHIQELSPQAEKNIISHIGPETWAIWRRWTQKT